MRCVMACLLLLIVAGCVAVEERAEETEENITENITGEPKIPPEEVEEVNETEEIAVNETVNETAGEIYVNETANETVNESAEQEISGILFGGGRYLLILQDAVWYGGEACAAVDIAYVNGTSIKKDVICPMVDVYWTAPDGHRFRIRITKVAAGYTGEAWAKVFIYG